MEKFNTHMKDYLQFCNTQKCLDLKTIRAYTIDLSQFTNYITCCNFDDITPKQIEFYIAHLHSTYKPKTAKRKIASLKAFFHYCEFKELINNNPFDKVQIRFRKPLILPKTISLHTLEIFLHTIYKQHTSANTQYKRRNALRDIAVAELLFSTGMRISELCGLTPYDVNLNDNIVLIYGKGAKERRIQIGNVNVVKILLEYKNSFSSEINKCNHFFVNQSGTPLSDQTVRRMINRYTSLASIEQHITPHMFRHTFASSLLDADVDIRYIQEMLGHSSINTTQIYTHVTMAKQKDILTTKHPRNDFNI
ncbi:MAG: tyrosine-type recombinase/integrase [Lachnospiraceae bacterium]|nr:tyrosine-type recombinase/integrase [Lachnospiraceae bacterium]